MQGLCDGQGPRDPLGGTAMSLSARLGPAGAGRSLPDTQSARTGGAARLRGAARQVICINWGTKYGPRFVDRLYGMVARHLTPPFRFVCFTDSAAGMRPEVECHPLPPVGVAMPTGTLGIWAKSRLWGPRLADLSGPVLFMDLDVVVTGSLDAFFDIGGPEDVILSRNPARPFERLGQTSVYRFSVGGLVALWDAFRADPQGVADRYRFEQRFVTRQAPQGIGFFPRAWVRHFRRDCRRPFPLNYALPPRLPRGARIVIFPGGLHPQHAIDGVYRDGEAPLAPRAHLARLFAVDRPETPIRYLRHYIRPAPWVARYWRV